jgi:hypothetical protein
MKFFINFLVFFSLLFLFGGLVIVGVSTSESNIQENSQMVPAQLEGYIHANEMFSINQIDSLTSNNNYYFTSANAEGISVKSVLSKNSVN